MIRYAGYDPTEDDLEFDRVELAPLPAVDAHRRGRRPLPVERAAQLQSLGWTWRDVAQELFWATGRRYTTDSVSGAVYRMKRDQKERTK